ncbi:hypothetical protein C5E41_14510 [Nocardia nova]|nr:hypothetical protein C5E41_14510 [Nocardia nova]
MATGVQRFGYYDPSSNNGLRAMLTESEVGREWIYSLRDYSPSERVRVLAIEGREGSSVG